MHQFRQQPGRQFFVEPSRPGAKADEAVRRQIVQLRKQNQSVYDINEALKREGKSRTPAAVAAALLAAGFDKTDVRISWLGNKRLRLVFG